MAVTKLLLIVATIGLAILLSVATLGWADGFSALGKLSKESVITFGDVREVWENIIESSEDDMWKYERAKELKEFMDTHDLQNEAWKYKINVISMMVELGEIDIEHCLWNLLSHLDEERFLDNYEAATRKYIRYHRNRFSTTCASILMNELRKKVDTMSAQHKKEVENLFDEFATEVKSECKGSCDFSAHQVELGRSLERFLREKGVGSTSALSVDNLYREHVSDPCLSWLTTAAFLQSISNKIGQMMTPEFDRIVNEVEMCQFIKRHEGTMLKVLRANLKNKPASRASGSLRYYLSKLGIDV